MENKNENKNENNEDKLPSEVIFNIKNQIHETYKYLEQVDVKGHQNSRIMNAVFDSLFKASTTLDKLQEEVMNLEGLRGNGANKNGEK